MEALTTVYIPYRPYDDTTQYETEGNKTPEDGNMDSVASAVA